VKLIIQKKKIHTQKKTNTTNRNRDSKKFSFLVKVLELFLRHIILVLAYKLEL
jgi:hypothetical protein